MTSFMIDTLLWTGALIALVLFLRRPVARWFGPQMAYLLWLLPLTRLLLPPLTLPAWLAPSAETAPVAQAVAPATSDAPASANLAPILDSGAEPLASASLNGTLTAAPMAADPVPWMAILLTIWLTGAAVFLAMRFRAYFQMRRMVLEGAAPVGEAMLKTGEVRLVESGSIGSPLAFGVIDRVVALPAGFMALQDRTARDLALDHELAHHRGGDLLMNFVIQPLFALHWFNPLAYTGWRAMRRDQEAACDARVVADRDAEVRATYGEVIAGFAAGPEFRRTAMLAAPMACPVLGDKSIIQRLRSLTMSDISPRRRFAGRAAIVGAALALPLTASITYAEVTPNATPGSAPEAPAAPEPTAVADIPAPPARPAPVGSTAPEAPETPGSIEAPQPPEPPQPPERANVAVWSSGPGETIVVSGNGRQTSADFRHFETRAEAFNDPEMQRRFAELETTMVRLSRDIEMRFSEEQMEALEEALEEASEAISERFEDGVVTGVSCDKITIRIQGRSEQIERSGGNCHVDAQQVALSAITTARDAVASDRNLSERERREALKGLDKALRELERSGAI